MYGLPLPCYMICRFHGCFPTQWNLEHMETEADLPKCTFKDLA